ncbi:MAG: hypothetical protein ACLVAW_13990 [Eisenbergiella massiliensis]
MADSRLSRRTVTVKRAGASDYQICSGNGTPFALTDIVNRANPNSHKRTIYCSTLYGNCINMSPMETSQTVETEDGDPVVVTGASGDLWCVIRDFLGNIPLEEDGVLEDTVHQSGH